MAKKNKGAKTAKPLGKTIKAGEGDAASEPISGAGWRVIAAGAGSVLLGFLALTRVDPMGRNWAATVSPLLILGGYALVGLGLFVPAPGERGEAPASVPPAQP